jgi:hypothetical protein
MIAGIFREGSGLGDQLFRYITVRTLAEEKGFDFGMLHPESFKGKEFISLDFGNRVYENNTSVWAKFNEKDVRDAYGNDIRSYDPEINFVKDFTVVDGSFEDAKYWGHNLENINEWLAVESLAVPDDLCVIGFRGGEYYSDPNLGLPKEYFENAIAKMREINPRMRFEVHTDDPILAGRSFPDFNVIANSPVGHSKHTSMGFNWRSARFAKYAIIPNSAFFILPRLLKHYKDASAVTIAPRYWARHNTRIWARPACFYKPFTYIHASDTN